MDSSYLRAVTSSALQGLLTAAWVAAGELPTTQRRLGRAGAVVGISALASIGDRGDEPAEETGAAAEPKPVTRRMLVATAITAGGAVGMFVGRRQLEKRWLGALARTGHPHPHRALALRMGLLSFAATLPARVVRAYEASSLKRL